MTKIVYVEHPKESYYQKLNIGDICECLITSEDLRGRIWVKIGEGMYNAFPPECFITLVEWRNRQIDEILKEDI